MLSSAENGIIRVGTFGLIDEIVGNSAETASFSVIIAIILMVEHCVHIY